MKNFFLLLCALFVLHGIAQEKDTDQKTLLSVVGGFHTLKVAESDFIKQSSEDNSGYSIGIQYSIFPDYEFSKALIRFGLEYSKEKVSTNRTMRFQDQIVLSDINTSLINLSAFAAYRFSTDTKIDAYVGGGFAAQALLSKSADSYQFTNEDGLVFPIFDENEYSYPIRYQNNAPRIFLGFILEAGAYLTIQEKLANVALGVLFSSDIEFSRKILQKNIFYLKVGYEIF
tara:strand:+ start:34493 stop:35179 length:687 start_codon:yes stop_codon:yes gene_type:complete